MTKYTVVIVACLAVSSALAQNTPGVRSEAPAVPGNCVQVGSTQNRIKDTGEPCQTAATVQGAVNAARPPLAIGSPVQGAVPNMCLTVDAAGNLAQASCLLSQ